MVDYIIKQADIAEMQPKLRKLFYEFLESQNKDRKSISQDSPGLTSSNNGWFPDKPNYISIEVAIGIILGLSESSRNLLEAIINGIHIKSQLSGIFGGNAKMNGTLGSINRRYHKRFYPKYYGEKRDNLKNLIEGRKILSYEEDGRTGETEPFPTEYISYELTVHEWPLKLAVQLYNLGYVSVSLGDIKLKYLDASQPDIILNSQAIQSAMDGECMVRLIDSPNTEPINDLMGYQFADAFEGSILTSGYSPNHSYLPKSLLDNDDDHHLFQLKSKYGEQILIHSLVKDSNKKLYFRNPDNGVIRFDN